MEKRYQIYTTMICVLLICLLMMVPTARPAETVENASEKESTEQIDNEVTQITTDIHRPRTIKKTINHIVAEESDTEQEIPKIESADPEKWNTEAIYLANMAYGEARGCSIEQKAAVMWCVLNRVDAGYGDIVSVITAPYQFSGWQYQNPITDELYDLALDVIGRWETEKSGTSDVGRVLPKEFIWFSGDGVQNYFRDQYQGGTTWNWSLPSPYSEE